MVMAIKVLITWSNWFIWQELINNLHKKKSFSVIEFKWNLLNMTDVELCFQQNKIDYIIHLVWGFQWDLDYLMKVNFETTRNLMEIWKEYGIKKVIYSSTGAVYWEPNWNISYETDICKPNTYYGLSKKLTEDLLLYYQNNYNIKTIILRFPNVYWKKSTHWVIYHFLKQIHEQNEIRLSGDGSQWRNFLYIDDAISAIIKCLNYDKSDIFNISTHTKHTLMDLINKLKEKYNFNIIKIKNTNWLKHLYLSTEKANEKLKFQSHFNELKI